MRAISRRGVVAAGALVVLGGLSAVAYRRSSTREAVAAEERDVPRLDGAYVRFSPGYAKRVGVRMEPCGDGTLSPVVSVTGTATFDPHQVAALGSRIAGRVRRVGAFEGDAVKAGEVVVELESAELGTAQAAIIAAKAHADAATTNEKRESELLALSLTSQRDLEAARATAVAARADLLAAEQRLKALGGSPRDPIGVLALASPIAGRVVEMNVSIGQSVEPTTTVARVADLSRLWIELAVFERELAHVRDGDSVDISPQTNRELVLKGTVAHVGDVIDLDTRSAPVRIVVDNPDGSLRPGQSVLARIHTRRTTANAILVPLDAVTSIDGKATLFVAHDETSVEARTVELGARDGTSVGVASGLAKGERVVTRGVFALKSEVFR